MSRFLLALVFGVCAVGMGSIPAVGQQYGDLTATFVYGGDPFVASPLKITSDKEFCDRFEVLDETLVVNPQNQGIANVFVWLFLGRGEQAPEPHPSYAETAEDKILLDNLECRFDPHALVLRTTQTLILGNSDAIGHNCKIDTFANPPINYTIPAGGQLEHQLKMPERLPARVSCSIHPWMSGWVLVKDNPYMAVSDADGKLEIKNVPVGTWTFQVWQQRAGYVNQVTIDGQPVEWVRGRLEIEINPGTNDVGTVVLAPELFAD